MAEDLRTNVPADGGLSGLGLVMSLAGSIFLILGCATVAMVLFALLASGGHLGRDGKLVLMMLCIGMVSVVRSWAHQQAGRRLLQDGLDPPSAAFARYFKLAAVQTAVVIVMLLVQGAPGALIATLVTMLAAWPIALALMLRTERIKPLLEVTLPHAHDRGFEGAGILMTVLGLTGLLFGVVMAISVMRTLDQMMKASAFAGMCMLIIVAILLIRSALHVRAGARGLGHDRDATVDAAVRYGNFGLIAAFASGGLFIVMLLVLSSGRGGDGLAQILLTIVFMTWGLAVWPNVIGKFFAERQHASLVADGPQSAWTEAPDRGLTTLGWFLFGQAVLSLSSLVPQAIFGETGVGRGDIMSMAMMGANVDGVMRWVTIGVTALQVCVGWYLITLRPNFKLLAVAWGVVAAGVQIFVTWPLLKGMLAGGSMDFIAGGGAGSIVFIMIAIGLIAPVSTIFLVQRKLNPVLSSGKLQTVFG